MFHNTVTSLVLQSGQAVDIPEHSPRQFWLSVLLLVGLAAVGAFLVYRSQYAGLWGRYSSDKESLEDQKLNQTPRTVRIRAGEAASQYRDDLLAAFDRDPASSADSDRETVLDAAVYARHELGRAWQPVTQRLPTPALRAFEVAAGVAVFGAIAVSGDRIVTWLLRGSPDRNVGGTVGDATGLFVEAVVEVATAFPYIGNLLALAFSLSLIVATTAYEYWYVTSVLIALVGVALVYLDRVASDQADMNVVLVDRRTIAIGVAKWTTLVWLAGVIPVGIGAAAGQPALGALAGVLLALPVALFASVRGVDHVASALYETAGIQHGLRHHLARPLHRAEGWLDGVLPDSAPADRARFRNDEDAVDVIRNELEYDPEYAALELDKQLREQSPEWPPAEPEQSVWERVQATADALLVLTARITSVVLALGTVLLAVYVAVAVALEGTLWTIAGATLQAPLHRQIVMLAVVGTPIAVLAYQARAAWPSLQAAVADVWARQRVRTALLRRGMPTVVVLASYPILTLFTSGMGFPWGLVVAGILAGLVGVLARTAISLLYRARYRVDLTPDRTERERTAVCHVYTLEDDDGQPLPTIAVNGTTTLSGRDRDAVVDDTVRVADAITQGGGQPATTSEYHARYAFDYGIVDTDEVQAKLRERARKQMLTTLRDAGGVVDRGEFDQSLDELPDTVVQGLFRELRRRGVVRRDTNYVYLERDPWTDHSGSGRSLFSRLASRV